MAVLSQKRLRSGLITEEILLDTLITYRPRYVIIERFIPLYGQSVLDEIDHRYDLVMEAGRARYFVLAEDYGGGL
jgi:hypothetical protein